MIKTNPYNKNKILNAVSWQGLATLIQTLSQLGIVAFLARRIPPEDFGLIALMASIMMLGTVLAQGGIKSCIINNSQSAPIIRAGLIMALSISLIYGALLFGFRHEVAIFFKSPEIIDLVPLFVVTFFITTVASVPEAIYEAALDFKKLFIVNFVSYIFGYAPVAVIAGLLDGGVWALALGAFVQSVVRWIMLRAKMFEVEKSRVSLADIKKVAVFSHNVNLAWICNYGALYSDQLIVGKLIGATGLGFYSMAFMIMDTPRKFLLTIIERVMFPVFSNIAADHSALRRKFITANHLTQSIILPLTVYLMLLSEQIVSVFLGNKWIEVVLTLNILLVQIAMRSYIRMADAVLTAMGLVGINARSKFIYMCSVIVFVWVGAKYGINGVAIGVTMAVIVNLMLTIYVLDKQFSIRWVEYMYIPREGVILSVYILMFYPLAKYLSLYLLPIYVIVLVSAAITIAPLFMLFFKPSLVVKFFPEAAFLLEKLKIKNKAGG